MEKINRTQYPPEVVKEASNENLQVSVHAKQLFDHIFKKAVDRDDTHLRIGVKLFSNRQANHIISLCFECAEWFRMGTDMDMIARLNQKMDDLQRSAPSIIKPDLAMMKDHIHPASFSELSGK